MVLEIVDLPSQRLGVPVMPGFMPGIHVFFVCVHKQDVDGRDKPGHDGSGMLPRLLSGPFGPK
jgi:hypothetical protein